MSKRKYSQCVRCKRTIDVTNPAIGEDGKGYEKEVCNQCAI
jgi:hypothetical protein